MISQVFFTDSTNQTKTYEELLLVNKPAQQQQANIDNKPTEPTRSDNNKQPKLKAFYRHKKQYPMTQNEKKLNECPTVRINPQFLKTLNS